jgi:predicted nucleic acid-binding protein
MHLREKRQPNQAGEPQDMWLARRKAGAETQPTDGTSALLSEMLAALALHLRLPVWTNDNDFETAAWSGTQRPSS